MSEGVTSTAGLMAVARVVADQLRGMTYNGRNMRVWASGTSVRFDVPGRFQNAPSEAQCIVELVRVGPGKQSIVKADRKFAAAMEQRVRSAL